MRFCWTQTTLKFHQFQMIPFYRNRAFWGHFWTMTKDRLDGPGWTVRQGIIALNRLSELLWTSWIERLREVQGHSQRLIVILLLPLNLFTLTLKFKSLNLINCHKIWFVRIINLNSRCLCNPHYITSSLLWLSVFENFIKTGQKRPGNRFKLIK